MSEGLLAFDVNENPLGTSTAARRAVEAAAGELHRYPMGIHDEVVALAAEDLGVGPDQVLLTAGLDEAVDVALLHARRATLMDPGFPGHLERASAAGVEIRRMRLDDAWDPPPVGRWVDEAGVVILAQPNNPTGNLVDPGWLTALLHRAERVLIDETYVDFSDQPSHVTLLPAHPNLCVFRSFSKTFGLAGLRSGVVVANPTLAAATRASYRYFPVDTISLHAVAASLRDREFRRASVDYVRTWRPRYAEALSRVDHLFREVSDTQANFVVAGCHTPDLAVTVTAGLLQHGIRVADCGRLGAPGWLRIGIGTAEQLDRLLGALATLELTEVAS